MAHMRRGRWNQLPSVIAPNMPIQQIRLESLLGPIAGEPGLSLTCDFHTILRIYKNPILTYISRIFPEKVGSSLSRIYGPLTSCNRPK